MHFNFVIALLNEFCVGMVVLTGFFVKRRLLYQLHYQLAVALHRGTLYDQPRCQAARRHALPPCATSLFIQPLAGFRARCNECGRPPCDFCHDDKAQPRLHA